ARETHGHAVRLESDRGRTDQRTAASSRINLPISVWLVTIHSGHAMLTDPVNEIGPAVSERRRLLPKASCPPKLPCDRAVCYPMTAVRAAICAGRGRAWPEIGWTAKKGDCPVSRGDLALGARDRSRKLPLSAFDGGYFGWRAHRATAQGYSRGRYRRL